MLICNYCRRKFENNVVECPGCGAGDFRFGRFTPTQYVVREPPKELPQFATVIYPDLEMHTREVGVRVGDLAVRRTVPRDISETGFQKLLYDMTSDILRIHLQQQIRIMVSPFM